MARNGSGTMLPVTNSWNPQITGTNATGPDFSALYTDLTAALTQSISNDGQTPIIGNLAMGNNKLTGLSAGSAAGNSLSWEQLFNQGLELSLASSTSPDIGAQLSVFILLTGAATITGFGATYKGPRYIRFAGINTLTNSATLVLPGGANITTAAGDTLIAYPIGNPATGWVVAFYQRASGAPVVPAVSPFFTGQIIESGAPAYPSGFLYCDGAAISRTTYAALFTAIGTTWGAGDGSTTFNVPDLRGRVTIAAGAGAGLTTRTLGQQNIGEENHQLTVGELAVHSHGVNDPTHTHGSSTFQTGNAGANSGQSGAAYASSGIAAALTGITIQNTGSGTPHNTMQPSAVVHKFIKT